MQKGQKIITEQKKSLQHEVKGYITNTMNNTRSLGCARKAGLDVFLVIISVLAKIDRFCISGQKFQNFCESFPEKSEKPGPVTVYRANDRPYSRFRLT